MPLIRLVELMYISIKFSVGESGLPEVSDPSRPSPIVL